MKNIYTAYVINNITGEEILSGASYQDPASKQLFDLSAEEIAIIANLPREERYAAIEEKMIEKLTALNILFN